MWDRANVLAEAAREAGVYHCFIAVTAPKQPCVNISIRNIALVLEG